MFRTFNCTLTHIPFHFVAALGVATHCTKTEQQQQQQHEQQPQLLARLDYPPLHRHPPCPSPSTPLALLLASKSFSCMAFARASLDLVCCLVRKPSEKASSKKGKERGRREKQQRDAQPLMISARSGRGCIPALALSVALARRRHRKQFSLPTFQSI